MADGGCDIFRKEELLLQVSAEKDSAELACAENGEFLAGKFAGHDANIVTEARSGVNKRLGRERTVTGEKLKWIWNWARRVW